MNPNNRIIQITNAGGGYVTIVTQSPHGLTNGQYVDILTNKYNGYYQISNITSSTFRIEATFTTTDIGYWQLPQDRPSYKTELDSFDMLRQKINQNSYDIGDKRNLTTDTKGSLSDAINETHVWERDSGTNTLSPFHNSGNDNVDVGTGRITANEFAETSLTTGRIPFVGSSSVIIDSSALKFSDGVEKELEVNGDIKLDKLSSDPVTTTDKLYNKDVGGSGHLYWSGIALSSPGVGVLPDPLGDGKLLKSNDDGITWSWTPTDEIHINDSGNVGIGTITQLAKLSINGGLHVGGDSDPGDNNAIIDGTLTIGSLTSDRIPYVSTGGIIVDSSNFSWNESTLTMRLGSHELISTDKTLTVKDQDTGNIIATFDGEGSVRGVNIPDNLTVETKLNLPYITSSYIPFVSTSGFVTGSSKLTWNDSTSNLYINGSLQIATLTTPYGILYTNSSGNVLQDPYFTWDNSSSPTHFIFRCGLHTFTSTNETLTIKDHDETTILATFDGEGGVRGVHIPIGLYADGGFAIPTMTVAGVVKNNAYGVLSGGNFIVNQDITDYTINRSKLVAGTANHVLINDASGYVSSEATLSITRGGTGTSSIPANRIPFSNGTGTALTSSSNVRIETNVMYTADLYIDGNATIVKTPMICKATGKSDFEIRTPSGVTLTLNPGTKSTNLWTFGGSDGNWVVPPTGWSWDRNYWSYLGGTLRRGTYPEVDTSTLAQDSEEAPDIRKVLTFIRYIAQELNTLVIDLKDLGLLR